jgi:ABC-type nitrate/sulfonate/bicarbonate transport system substrate-binding protein
MKEGIGLVVRPDGKIGTLDDLVEKNATIGVPIGSTAHMFLDFMFYAAYGKGVEDTGITLVDMSVQDALLFPKGIDAIAIWGSTPFKLKEKGLGEILVSEKGDAGPAWTGAVEKGKVPFFKDSVFYPEGFQMTRGFGFVRKAFGDEYPDLVVAQMLAILESMKALDQTEHGKGQELAWDYTQNWEFGRLCMRTI